MTKPVSRRRFPRIRSGMTVETVTRGATVRAIVQAVFGLGAAASYILRDAAGRTLLRDAGEVVPVRV